MYFDSEVFAYIDEEIARSEHFSFRLNLENDHNEPFHTILPTEAVLGDTIKVMTYISQVKEGEIDPTYVNITVEFQIYNPSNKLFINNTYSKKRGIYYENGYFLTCYIIPSNLTLDFTSKWEIYLLIDIYTSYSTGDSFYHDSHESPSVRIGGGFKLITKYDVYEDQIDYHILTLNYDFQPVSNVSFDIRASYYNKNWKLFENSSFFPDNTNNEERSTFDIPIDSDVVKIDIIIYANKGNISSKYDFWINPFIQEDDYDDNAFDVFPTLKSLEYYYSYYEYGYWVEYQALMGNQPLCNQEIVTYVGYEKGIIQISTETTDSNGYFNLLFPWPTNPHPQDKDLTIMFSYYNGTDWFDCNEFFYFYPSLRIAEPEFVTTQENIVLDIQSINYSDYQILNFSFNLPTKYINFRSSEFWCVPVYNYTYYWRGGGDDYDYYASRYIFCDYHSFGYPDDIPPSGLIQASCLIDTTKKLEFIIVELYLLNESSSTYHRLVWFLNPDGTLRELPEPPAKPLFDFDPNFVQLLFRVTLFIIVVSTCIGLILWTKRRSIKM